MFQQQQNLRNTLVENIVVHYSLRSYLKQLINYSSEFTTDIFF